MRKSGILVLSIGLLVLGGLQLSSCKKHETPVKPKLSFPEAAYTVKENDGMISIPITLDRAASEAITITYELGGTATDKVSAGNNKAYDYEISSSYLEAKIAKGALSDTIQIKLYSDFTVEDDEIIEIILKSVDSDNIEITNKNIVKITIKQEDGLAVFLDWKTHWTNADSTADMDMFLRVGSAVGIWDTGLPDGVIDGSYQQLQAGPEFIFVPYAITSAYAAFGMSYVYYEGEIENLRIGATFIDLVDGVAEDPSTQVTDSAIYSQANLNKWDINGINTTVVAQSFLKSGTKFGDPTAITVPPSGSRIGTSSNHFITPMQRTAKSESMSNLMKSLLEKK